MSDSSRVFSGQGASEFRKPHLMSGNSSKTAYSCNAEFMPDFCTLVPENMIKAAYFSTSIPLLRKSGDTLSTFIGAAFNVLLMTVCAGRSRVRACRYISSRKTVVWRHQRTRYCSPSCTVTIHYVSKNEPTLKRYNSKL